MTAGSDPQARPWRSAALWTSVADELRGHLERGLGGLLTEDVVRFTTARALVAAGVDAAGLRAEAPHAALKGARVDLVVGHRRPAALVEFKFPRGPSGTNVPWTMILGEVLKDLYRLAAHPGEVDRIFAYVETDRLREYMTGAARRRGIDLDTDAVVLSPTAVAALPATASVGIGAGPARHRVTATRLALVPVDDTLRLAVYLVDPFTTPGTEDAPAEATRPAPVTRATRNGARREILDAVHAVLTRSGAPTFTVAEVIAEMTRRGTGYAESTIRTMVTSHLCRNAPDHAAVTHDDLERVDRGRYRPVTG